eukprot:GEMP01028939.1.p1 GENE.GEMP01028939.1~~GEMP01028939.1.p1  ORF type:complete len:727 (+),score=164.44 GEMP01028939.1:99-2183(+)
MFMFHLLIGGGVAVNQLSRVTPVDKVINLLADLQSELTAELAEETKTYDAFLKGFCVDQSLSLQESVDDANTQIDSNQAGFDGESANGQRLTNDVANLNKDIEDKAAEKARKQAAFNKAKATYEVTEADLAKAISSLNDAIDAIQASKGSFLSMSVKAVIEKNLAMAQAIGISTSNKPNFLQGPGDYDFHSGDILDILRNLQKEFTDKKSEVDSDFSATESAWTQARNQLTATIADLNAAVVTKTEQLNTAIENKGTHEFNLAQLNKDLTHDSNYLKDLTLRCTEKGKQWTQREQGRKGEIEAVGKALEILQEKVQAKDSEVNKRVLIQQVPRKKTIVDVAEDDVGSFAASFIQTTRSIKRHEGGDVSAAISLLQESAKELKSATLAKFADKLSTAGPFDKVKRLIQQLIERLLTEAANEAKSQGNCGTKVTAATNKRNSRAAQVTEINANLEKLEAFRMSLENDIEALTNELDTLRKTLKEDTENRDKEKEDNLTAIQTAEEGLDALDDAIKVLTLYYRGEHTVGGADTAKVFVQAEPLDEQESYRNVAGTEGAYQGSQAKAGNIFGLLQTIRSDFTRTIRTTTEAEKESATVYVLSSRENRSNTKGKDTEKSNKENDFEVTKAKISEHKDELNSQMELVANAVKELEDLWPLCVAVDMDFASRKEKMVQEVEALKKACKVLLPEGGVDDCPA